MQAPPGKRGPSRGQPIVPGPAGGGQAVTLYHWLVVILAACGWLFDCMGQRIFVLSREPALKELLGTAVSDDAIRNWGGAATALMMVGWGTGGIIFGLMSDRYGRVKAMVTTLLAYTVFSGLAGFARNGTEFLVYRLLFGIGVGGMFGAATTLVAESVPPRVRTVALGCMQAVSAGGTMLASALSLGIPPGQENFWGRFSGWQALCFVGVCPAILALPMALILKEPEAWRRAKADAAQGRGKAVGSMGDLVRHPRWRRGMVVGICLGVAGMAGLWGIAFFSPELITSALKNRPLQAGEILKPVELCARLNAAPNVPIARLKARLDPAFARLLGPIVELRALLPPDAEKVLRGELNRFIQEGPLYDASAFQSVPLKKSTQKLVKRVEQSGDAREVGFLNRQLVEQLFPGTILELQRTIDKTRSRGTMLQDLGAMLGMFTFTFAASYFNRRKAFLGAFGFCLVAVAFVFYSLKTAVDVYWMLPLMGFGTLSVFAGYSIYFPELFPTRLRGTGVGLCYNTVRYLTAPFPFLMGWLGTLAPFRTVGVAMCSVYLVGIVALLWAPETKGQPLPED